MEHAMKKCSKAATCVYCAMPLSKRHEHDHFPLPQRNKGTNLFCVCRNCHDLKDRVPFYKWDARFLMTAFAGLWSKANGSERIILAKMATLCSDAAKGLV
jgi:hypothetical protein